MKLKKILFLIILCMCVSIIAGCDTNSKHIDHPISGKIYYYYGGAKVGNISVYIYFYSNGICDQDYVRRTSTGDEHNRCDRHLEWQVEGNKVSIYHDNSTYWKASERGTLLEKYTYDSSKNVLINERGTEYVYWREVF